MMATRNKLPKLDTFGLDRGQLIFRYADIEQELESACRSFKKFLVPGALDILQQLKRELGAHRSNRVQGQLRWETRRDAPICTIASKGEYEPKKRKGGATLVGKVGLIWEIRSVWPAKDTAKGKAPKHFCLDGKATVSIEICDDSSGQSVSALNFDIAAPDSSGCFFHAQVPDNKYKDVFMYPVPRVPVFIYTPTDALDFLLGELFQERWPAHVVEKQQFFDHQNGQQRHRFTCTLNWLSGLVSKCEGGSVWSHMKGEKPDVMLLLGS